MKGGDEDMLEAIKKAFRQYQYRKAQRKKIRKMVELLKVTGAIRQA